MYPHDIKSEIQVREIFLNFAIQDYRNLIEDEINIKFKRERLKVLVSNEFFVKNQKFAQVVMRKSV